MPFRTQQEGDSGQDVADRQGRSATPKFAVRKYTRCRQCGRPRGYLRKFQLCRICFRKLALAGESPA